MVTEELNSKPNSLMSNQGDDKRQKTTLGSDIPTIRSN